MHIQGLIPHMLQRWHPPILPDLSVHYRFKTDLAQVVWKIHALECGYKFNAAHAHTHRFTVELFDMNPKIDDESSL